MGDRWVLETKIYYNSQFQLLTPKIGIFDIELEYETPKTKLTEL